MFLGLIVNNILGNYECKLLNNSSGPVALLAVLVMFV